MVKIVEKPVIVVLGTLDTKGNEVAFLAAEVRRHGYPACIMDIGLRGEPSVTATLTREEVSRAAGSSLDALASLERTDAMLVMGRGAAALLDALLANHRLAGVIAVGGGKGTWIATYAMRTLPLGLPKVMVSTGAGRDVRRYVGHRDIAMIPSIADIAGLNRITRPILANAAGAVCGMANAGEGIVSASDRPAVALTMFGITTPCGQRVQQLLEVRGYETIVFHANGAGGAALEELIGDGLVGAVIDFTTTELADESLGGICSAGPHRLEAAGHHGLPQIIVPGALDAVNFGPPETVPAQYAGRRFIRHTPDVTLMRTTAAENDTLGALMAAKLNPAIGPVQVLIPTGGFSAYDQPGQPFYDPVADRAFVTSLRSALAAHIPLREIPYHINDAEFAPVLVSALDGQMAERERAQIPTVGAPPDVNPGVPTAAEG